MKFIPLTQNRLAKVSDHRFDYISNFGSWRISNGYAVCTATTAAGRKTVYMQHLILSTIEGFEVDHIDGDGTNNQDDNLRYVTRTQQMHNRCRNRNNTSGVAGV